LTAVRAYQHGKIATSRVFGNALKFDFKRGTTLHDATF
jgi:hypothetical protein